ncbi:methylenetetrahydrofolate--tRNA-(uracil(54)-C(5))-methyltransferase (FADH(2)-oxidizing) TrmFO, partial [bacterium]|nr:methylenetetrahydrofolate--tRNA-(uracil(54)-C(5))-methyltransferase (FADH(2)-oxidizing) TrmFO [bacterium]
MRQNPIHVIGGGLAGSEATFQIAMRGIPVILHEMRPTQKTEAHTTSQLAELVCSNSFGSVSPNSASRILKDELKELGAFVLSVAESAAVPAGASLAVDRIKLSEIVTDRLENHPLVTIKREEVNELPADAITILATGPLTSPKLIKSLQPIFGDNSLYFYDAISPIVSTDSLNLDKIFCANRYDKGETKDFLNIPLTEEQYNTLVDDLLSGEVVLPHNFEEEKYFESCMPIEAIAARGRKTLAFGPMKPVGLTDPTTGKRPFAVIQLRTENRHKTSYNLVGFQTKLKYKEQERIFRKLPGLESADFLRLGSMHRNTYIDSPRLLDSSLSLRKNQKVFVAGQLTGTEGYLESTATGLLAGINAAQLYLDRPSYELPETTILGALLQTITDSNRTNFQPM